MRRLTPLALAVAATLGLAACGSDSSTQDPDDSPTTQKQTEEAPAGPLWASPTEAQCTAFAAELADVFAPLEVDPATSTFRGPDEDGPACDVYAADPGGYGVYLNVKQQDLAEARNYGGGENYREYSADAGRAISGLIGGVSTEITDDGPWTWAFIDVSDEVQQSSYHAVWEADDSKSHL